MQEAISLLKSRDPSDRTRHLRIIHYFVKYSAKDHCKSVVSPFRDELVKCSLDFLKVTQSRLGSPSDCCDIQSAVQDCSFLKKLFVKILSGMHGKDSDLAEIPDFLHCFFAAIFSEADGLHSRGQYSVLPFP